MVGPLTGHKISWFSTFSVRWIGQKRLCAWMKWLSLFLSHQATELPSKICGGSPGRPGQISNAEMHLWYKLHIFANIFALYYQHGIIMPPLRSVDGWEVDQRGRWWHWQFFFFGHHKVGQRRIYQSTMIYPFFHCYRFVQVKEKIISTHSLMKFNSTILGARLWSLQLVLYLHRQLFARFRVMATALSIRRRPEVIEWVRWSHIRVLWLYILTQFLILYWYTYYSIVIICYYVIIILIFGYIHTIHVHYTCIISRCVGWCTPWTCAICHVQRCSSC